MLAALPLVFVLHASPAADTGASPADAVVAAAFADASTGTGKIDTKSAGVQGADVSFSPTSLIAPALGLVGVIALTFTLKRRKKTLGGTGIALLEATSLGDKRSLVIADVLGERMVLGVSEAGITVLMSKPAPSLNEDEPIRLPPATQLAPSAAAQPMGFFQRLVGKSPAPAFDAALQESVEDQELRAKLQAGVRSVVP